MWRNYVWIQCVYGCKSPIHWNISGHPYESTGVWLILDWSYWLGTSSLEGFHARAACSRVAFECIWACRLSTFRVESKQLQIIIHQLKRMPPSPWLSTLGCEDIRLQCASTLLFRSKSRPGLRCASKKPFPLRCALQRWNKELAFVVQGQTWSTNG